MVVLFKTKCGFYNLLMLFILALVQSYH